MKRFLGRRLGGKGGLNQRRLRKPVIESLHERVVYAADMQFVKDINTLPDLAGSTPAEFVQIGTTMYFSATSAATGLELWKTDGTAAGTVLVKDIQDGAYGAGVRNLTNVNGTLFFSADDGVGGYELWKSDGTSAGTTLVSDIQRGRRGSSPSNFVALGSTLIFSADDGSNGVELWQSNGTAAGTTLVRNIRTGNVGSNPGNMTAVTGSVYFTADDGTNGVELWKTDGTNAGTVLVRNIRTGVAGSTPSSLVNVNGTLYFSANDGTNGVELWKSSGTVATTVLVRSIFAGLPSANPTQLTNVGGTLYFAADDGTSGVELWKSDGTNAGTVRVADIQAGAVGSNPSQFLSVGTTLYFAAQTSSGVELWKSTGTAAGTTLVKDIQVGAGSSTPTGLMNNNGTVFFAADDGVNGVELWKTDGTAAGTVLVQNINTTAGVGSNPSRLAVLNGKLLFQATDGLTGSELWQSDGTAVGTTQLKDILAGNLGSQIGLELTTAGGNFYFSANDGVTGSELWKSDGTAAGTVLVKDIAIGGGDSTPTFLANVGGVLYFSADDGVNGVELWKSDGTDAGTVLVKDIAVGLTASAPTYLTNVNGTLFFTATNGTNGIELWKSDGTAAGTVMVRDINGGGAGSVPTYLTNINGTLFFVATDLAGGTELWKSNGTAAGTVRVKDIRTGVASGLSARAGLVNVAGTLYFAADNGTSGVELWKSDGTDAGTVMVRDILPGAGSSYPEGLANVAGVLYFTGTDGVTGYELWKSDGTTAGTVLVADSVPGAGGLYPHYITGVNGTVFFQADDGVNGAEFWKSDGTAAGTQLVRDISPGLQSSTPTSLVGVSGVVYFKANDGINGPELWQSDGTTAGTVRTTTVTSTPIGIAPSVLANFNNRLVFAAVDNLHGGELWAQVPNIAPTDIQISASVIAENSVAPTAIGDFSTTDPDVGDLFTYSIVAGVGDADNASFEVVGATLRARSSFDFETKPSYTVRVRSTDKGGLFTEKAFVISVTNVNEAPTDILLSVSTIPENSGANVAVGTLNTTDVDAANTFTYSLVAGTGDVDNAAFNIIGSTLQATSSFDFETKPSYTVRVRSTDQGGLFTEKAFVINVTNVNEAPTDIALSVSTIPENAGANAAVGTLSTTDIDAANTFTYSLVAGAGDVDNAAFNIDGSTVQATSSFDFETKPSYTVRVRSTDQGGLFTEKAFVISVTNVNEAPTDILLSVSTIPENSGANAAVGTLNTTDVDAANTFTYSLVAGAGDVDNAVFNIIGSTLQATSSFDFETKPSYTVRVRSTDQGGLFTEKAFVISVTNVNESPTDIALSVSTIPENSGANAAVGTLSTTDVDAANTFTYSLVAGTGDVDNAAFNIIGSTLQATSSFDFETKPSYTIRVRSTDQGGLFTEKAFVINVTNVNEAPTDIALSVSTIPENAGANATVGTLSTTDVDAANTFTYSLVAGVGDVDNAAFNIFGSTLRATGNLDFETKPSYTVRVRSTDQGGLLTEKAFVISVTNVNEAPTDILLSVSTIPENSGANAAVGTLNTTDVDAANTFTYSLVAGAGDVDNAAFNIIGSTLQATSSFDFETKPSYTVRVRSTDQGGLLTEKAFVISVTNVNEAPTDLALSVSTIPENAGANATVGALSTTDVDSANTFTYSLVAGTGDVDNASFNISGNLLRATNSLDFEAKSTYTVRVRSVDQGGLFTEKVFVISVTNVNEAPTDIGLSSTTILENSGANATVGALSTVDGDVSNTFSYALVAGAGDVDNAAFNISGNLLRATSNLSFATKSSYSIRLRSTDQGGLSFDKTFTILVLQSNQAPTDISLVPGFVFENAGANASVGALSTTDPNAGNTFTYSLVVGLGDGDNAAFNVLGSTLRANASFDYETRSSYAVRVRTTDQGGLFTEKAFIVNVLNANEAPTDIILSGNQIVEGAIANTTVGLLSTIDVDAANSFAYTLVAGAGDADNAAFNINGNALRATSSFDFETKSSYTVRVRTTDQGGLFTEKVFVISVTNVNEAPTDVTISSTSIAEGAGVNATVGNLGTIDPDTGNTFVYTLVAGVGDVDNAAFNISGTALQATSNFDFETRSSYTVRIRSTDQGGLFLEKAFVINVTNVNETPTDILLSSAMITENSGANASVGTLSTNDPDVGNSFTYTLVAGTGDVDNAAFNINGNALRATSNFDFETKSSYTVRVRSTDQGGLFTEKAFVITVSDVNESPTDLALSSTSIPENSGANAVVGTLSSTDPDVGNTFAYTMVAGTGDVDNTAFNISGNVLRATSNLVFASKSVYSVRIRSTDQGGLFAERVFVINVTSVNSAPSDITLSSSLIAENSGANAVVGSLSSIDANAGDTFTYTLVVGTGDTDNSSFNINGTSLRATNSLDFETKSSYTLRVRSTDQGGLFTEKAFVISVGDVNETPTDIVLSSVLIAENAGANGIVGTLSSTDPDVGNTFTHVLVAGTGDADNAAFNISGNSLRATSSLDFETKSSYTLRVRSTDQGGLFTEKVFVISVVDVNEAPTDLALTSTSIPENSGANATVGTFSSTDPDASNTFVYALIAGAGDVDNASFNISGNVLRATNNLIFAAKSSYTIRVRTTDQGGLFAERSFVINVTSPNTAPNDITLSSTSISENLGANATVGSLSTTDGNVGDTFTYTLVAGLGDVDNAAFNISGNLLRATNNLDFETKSSYTVRVRSTDQGGLFTEKAFAITVLDAPEDILIAGTAGNDTIIANYTGDGVVAQWLVTRNGGVVFSGIVPVGQNLWFDGLAGTDTLQVVGRSIDDSLTLDGLRIAANGAWARISNIESVRILGGNGNDLLRVVSGTASFDGGGGVDRVEATAGANTFTLTGNGTGNLNSTLTFTTIESVQGGIDSDRFVFGASGSLTGQVIGGLGVDTIDLSAKTGTNTLNFTTGMLTSTGGFFGIESFVSGSNTADTVTGPNVDSLWDITGPSAWNLNGEITFNGFENLTGGTGADLFEFLPTGRVVGTLNGGAGADVASFVALATPVQVQLGTNAAITGLVGRYTAVERVNGNGLAGSRIVGTNAATAWGVNAAGEVVVSNVTYSAIPSIAGGTAADTLTGPAVATQWTLNGANAGSVTVGAVALAFTGVENLTGSTASDEFIVLPTGSLSGNINGGTGTGINSVDYSAWSTNVVVNLSVTTAGNATGVSGAMTGIGMVTGGAGNDSLTGRARLSTILIGLGGNDVLIGGSQRDLLIGGTGADILQGAAGDDLLISGTTLHERDRVALLQILAEWTSTRTFAQRTANIWGNGTGTRANGTTYLNNSAADSITDSVFADTDTDLLTGGTNQDWFFAAPGEISDLVTAGATPDRRD